MVEFNFMIHTASGVPIYRQIVQQVEYSMSVGLLKVGDKLPTVRKVAVSLKVNPNTVAKAYNELEIRGFVNTLVGSGTYISEKKVEISEIERDKIKDKICSDFLRIAFKHGFSANEITEHLKSFKEEQNV